MLFRRTFLAEFIRDIVEADIYDVEIFWSLILIFLGVLRLNPKITYIQNKKKKENAVMKTPAWLIKSQYFRPNTDHFVSKTDQLQTTFSENTD